jgi:hypothetical protein
MYSPRLSQRLAGLRRRLLGAALATLPLLTGCQSMSNTDKGALGGAAVGTAAGAVIGHAAHNTAAGAVIGGLTGLAVGATAGAVADEHQARQAVAQDVAARGGPVTLEKVVEMVHNNVSDQIIVDQIHMTRTLYQLTVEQITWLKQNGVSDYVIHEMEMTAYPRARGVVVVEPPPPPPVRFGVTYIGR